MKTARLTVVKSKTETSAILLIHCRDQRGIVASVTKFIAGHHGNIIHLDQHVDTSWGIFFMRVEWEMTHFDLSRSKVAHAFKEEVSDRFNMHTQLYFSDQPIKTAIFVSKEQHCLIDLLSRQQAESWPWDLRLVISNHKDLKGEVTHRNIRYLYTPVKARNKKAVESAQLKALQEERVELIVLARYMQIISPDFCEKYKNRIINIHHSFLPAFPGAKPYHSAFNRGVKIIGATSHFATPELDDGPIIDQDTVRISHEDGVKDLIRKGRDLERIVLARAVWQFLQRRVLVYENKTINFM
ncbi:MAG: formyltetrahydrofolate deformylase [Candidatus Omnitrophica bacterium]|nr:formyltetrahydrofolate deformylase [Candidatus Omnitrophota bacterium]